MRLLSSSPSLLLLPLLYAENVLSEPSSSTSLQLRQPLYSRGDVIPIQCLNRTIDTGEHVQNPQTGALQYIPFFTCNETSSPFSLRYLLDSTPTQSCTIASVSDELYHHLEFYIHHDTPLSCRIPARPLPTEGAALSSEDAGDWIPLIVALTGKMELSHLHIETELNVMVHTEEVLAGGRGGRVLAAAAYSIPARHEAERSKIIIGDALQLVFRVRWFVGTEIVAERHVHSEAGRMVFWCVLSALVGAVGCYAWTVGVDLPRRIKRMRAWEKITGAAGAKGGIIGNFGNGGAVGGNARGVGYGYGFPGTGNGVAGGGFGYGGKRKD